MAKTKKKKAFWDDFPQGFHHRRLGTKAVGFETYVWKGEPGPVVLANAGTHGDEYEGPNFLISMVNSWRPRKLRGTVVIIPVLNEAAFMAGLRCHPGDGKNLARSFPGRPGGSPIDRLAHLFLKNVISYSDYYFDFHSAGVVYEIAPWVGYVTHPNREINKTQEKMAACFDKYWCWSAPYLPGRTASAAYELNIPFIYTEGQGGGGILQKDVKILNDGFFEFLKRFGFIKGRQRKLCRQHKRISKDPKEAFVQIHHKAPTTGMLDLQVKLKEAVKKGQILGYVYPLNGKPRKVVKAEMSGKVVFLRRKASIEKGEGVMALTPIQGKL